MVVNEATHGNPEALVDEQEIANDPPTGAPQTIWQVGAQFKNEYPVSAYLDLGHARHLSTLWLYDLFNVGFIDISIGEPGKWQKVATYETVAFKKWAQVPLEVTTRYVRFTRQTGGAQVGEAVLYEYSPETFQALQASKVAAAKAKAERETALAAAQKEVANRPLVDCGPLFGSLPLVDEVDCAQTAPTRTLVESPANASKVERLLGTPCRVLPPVPGEAAYFSYRLGRYKLLTPGKAYLLTVEYPEDAPRSMMVLNSGNETCRGFHTGPTVGDALYPKYVNNNSESLRVPLSGRYETWKMLFNLHDRFPDRSFPRGKGVRSLMPEDGFDVTIVQFSAENDPPSHGAAVRRIRLFEVPDPARLQARYTAPPAGLPRRHIFWREEMADGVIDATKEEERGLKNPLDWYRYKAEVMQFLAINTYTKDLLEFGACQHWDSTPGGGNEWVYFNNAHKNLWSDIVKLMGERGFSVLPYYEYSGSKGSKGLGPQRRAKPLTRNDAYTHIKWIESANADLTDPDTRADFQKMLDVTMVRFKDSAQFLGAWMRPRSQLPIGFGDATRQRFATEANHGKAVTREELQASKPLLDAYYDWWYGKRREFLLAMRDHLRQSGVNSNAFMLYTTDASEPGVSLPSWDRHLVTDNPAGWLEWLKQPPGKEKPGKAITPEDVYAQNLYLQAMQTGPLRWGGWEPDHGNPPADPKRYQNTEGVLLTHAFNRSYTVGDARTFDAFRTLSGLALVRHYTLNENMAFDREDHEKLGYFAADIERAGPYCLLAEARAMANGDPRFLGYLVGRTFNRGFPEYVRAFNTAFLSLPALPSSRLKDACADAEITVRSIPTPQHGTYLAIVNTGFAEKSNLTIRLPPNGRLTDAVTGDTVSAPNGILKLSLYPCQLRALRLQTP
ncbi:MAG: hypothetical protein WCO56_07470 [Verrucomicrobiota bacterium]